MLKIVLLGNFKNEILEPEEPLKEQFHVKIKTSVKNLQSYLSKNKPDAVFYRIKRITESTEKSITLLLKHNHKPLIYIVSSNISLKWIVDKVKMGVTDYIELENFERNCFETLKTTMCQHLKRQQTQQISSHPALKSIIGNSPEMQKLKNFAYMFAKSGETLLITGETGTGKGLLAETIHRIQFGNDSPFVGRNCGAIPDQLFESEVFGSTKGSFTDAKDRPGYFEQANTGTLFLDEIGEISPHLQVKILQAVEEKQILRLGDQKKIPVNIRLISATNKNLSKAVKKGSFRSDLYYRLNTLKLHIPPLRKRKDDLFQLSNYILDKNGSKKNISEAAMNKILSYDWPGNVRELITVLKRADILSENEDIILPEHITLD